MIAFNKVDRPANNSFSVSCHLFRSTQTEVSKGVNDIIRLGARIHSVCDRVVPLLHIRKGTIAVPNNVEVPEVKVRREPHISHSFHFRAIPFGWKVARYFDFTGRRIRCIMPGSLLATRQARPRWKRREQRRSV